MIADYHGCITQTHTIVHNFTVHNNTVQIGRSMIKGVAHLNQLAVGILHSCQISTHGVHPLVHVGVLLCHNQ